MSESNFLNPSPIARNKCGQVIGHKQKVRVINFYESKLRSIQSSSAESLRLADLGQEVSEVTGIYPRTISKIIKEYGRTKTMRSPNRQQVKPSAFDKMDEVTKTLIRKKSSFILLKE